MAEMEAAATTEARQSIGGNGASGQRPRGSRRKAAGGPDRTSVILFSTAAFLAVLALLAWQLRATTPRAAAGRVVIVRRIYQTTVVETIRGPGSGTSISQSVSSSGPASAGPAPIVTGSSTAR
jgi:hypothetical protein